MKGTNICETGLSNQRPGGTTACVGFILGYTNGPDR